MRQAHERVARRQAVNLTADSELVQRVREEKGNLSALLEDAMREFLVKRELVRWRDENRQSFESYNEMIEREGLFADDMGVI